MVGANCVIGNNVTINDSYIWDNVVIEDGCTIDKCIIASNVKILKNAVINQGCIISHNVVIDENMNVKSYSCLINDEDTATNEEAVGKNGKGTYYEQELDSDDENEETEIWPNLSNGCDDDSDDDASSVSTSFSDSSEDEDRAESPVLDEYACKYCNSLTFSITNSKMLYIL